MPNFVEERGSDLPADLRFTTAHSFDVSLVEVNPVWGSGPKDAFFSSGNAVKQAQQYSSAFRLRRWRVFYNNRHVGKPFTKCSRQIVQGIRDDCLKFAPFHVALNCNRGRISRTREPKTLESKSVRRRLPFASGC